MTHYETTRAKMIDASHQHSKTFYILDSGVLAPIGDPYHCTVFCTFQIQYTTDKPYKRQIWQYDKCNFDDLNEAIHTAPWGVLEIYDDVDEAVDYFMDLLLSISKEHIPNKEITVYPKDKPWMTDHVKQAIKLRDKAHKKWKKDRTEANELAYRNARHEVNVRKFHAKLRHEERIIERLQDRTTSSKEYWHLTKMVYGSKVKPGIPSIIDGDQVYSDARSKANVFNQHFAEKASLPDEVPDLPEPVYKTEARLESLTVTVEETEKILNNLNTAKANGPDNVSNRLLKGISASIAPALTKLCNLSLSSGTFPARWKDAHVSPVHKKNDKQTKKNYRPISLLSNLSKILERHVFIALYDYCIRHKLLTWRNSGYKYMDSTINQLVYLCHKIYEALEKGEDVCFISLDASAAFDRVWHKGLIYKLKCMGITGTLLAWLVSYLTDRRQRVVISGEKSEWTYIKAGVPQGSILGPLLFLIYVDDIITDIESEILLFADDTSLFEPITNPNESIAKLNRDLDRLSAWASQWLVNFNPEKTKYMIFSKKLDKVEYEPLFLDGKRLERVQTHTQLGITFSEDFTWDKHIKDKCTAALKRVNLLKRLALKIPRQTKLIIYTAFIRPLLEYGCVLFDNCTSTMSEKMENVQRQAALAISGAYRHTKHTNLLKELGLALLSQRRIVSKVVLLYKMITDRTPAYLRSLLPGQRQARYQTRQRDNITLPKIKKNYFLKSFIPSGIRLWNQLSNQVRGIIDLDDFKRSIKKMFTPEVVYKPYLMGHSREFINLSRLRMGLSGLNSHRKKYHFIDHRTCPHCLARNEDCIHFFLICPTYAAQRAEMAASLSLLLPNTRRMFDNMHRDKKKLIEILLFGIKNETLDEQIFQITAKFIKDSERF